MIIHSNSPDAWMEAAPGSQRRILCHNKDIMMVEFRFETGTKAPLHNHPHTQTTYVDSGRFEFTVGDETKILEPGDGMVIPSNVMHGCVCLEAGSLKDAFAPRRDDFLEAHGIPVD